MMAYKNDYEDLYKIGTGWLYDAESKTGYKVNFRENGKKYGAENRQVESFDEAFKIVVDGSNFDIQYKMEVPIGIVRRALHLNELRYREGGEHPDDRKGTQ